MADQLQGAVDKAKSFKVQDLTTYVRNLTKDPPTLATIQPRVLQGIQACTSRILMSLATIIFHTLLPKVLLTCTFQNLHSRLLARRHTSESPALQLMGFNF